MHHPDDHRDFTVEEDVQRGVGTHNVAHPERDNDEHVDDLLPFGHLEIDKVRNLV
jgi:hypothetical protein